MPTLLGEMPTRILVDRQTENNELPSPTKTVLDDLLCSQEGIEVHGENLSILDPLAPPEKLRSMNDHEIFDLVLKHLDRENLTPEEEQTFFNELSVDIENANKFLRDTLRVPSQLSFSDENLPIITSREDLIKLIKETTIYNSGKSRNKKNQPLLRHMKVCALITTTIATHHLRQRESQKLMDDAETFDKMLCFGTDSLFVEDPMDIGKECRKKLLNTGKDALNVNFCSRGKSPESLILKYLGKVKDNANEALKDGVAVRIEGKKNNIKDIAEHIASYLQIISATNITCKIKGAILNESDFHDLKEALSPIRDKYDQPIDFPQENNPISNARYRDIKFLANIMINGRKRSVEFQITQKANKNESGMSNHNVYDFSKKVRLFTLLFGRCPQQWIDAMLAPIEEKTGLKKENIITSLIEEGVIAKAPGNKGYIDVFTYRRWCAVKDLIPDEYCHAIRVTRATE